MKSDFVMGCRYKPNRFTIDQVREFWDSIADEYVHESESLAETHFQRFDRAFAHFQPSGNMRALNIWSRNGEAIDYFRRLALNLELVNAEVSPRLIDKARKQYPNESFIQTDLILLPFADDEFDFILSLETLEHAPDPLRFLRELARVLKPGGKLVLSCPPAMAELPLWIYELFMPNHGEGPHRFPSTREVKSLLHAAGLDLEIHESTLFIPAGPRFIRRFEPVVERILKKTPLTEFGIRQFFVCRRHKGAGPWQTLIRDVVETGLCTRCGTCVGVCPTDVFKFHALDDDCLPVATRPEACIRCGLCTDVCPGGRVSFAKIRSAANDAPIQSTELGPIRHIRIAHASDASVRASGGSGGVVTAMLCNLFDRGEITGAIVLDSHPEMPWRPWPKIARTTKEIIHAAQSKYCVTPTNVALKDIRDCLNFRVSENGTVPFAAISDRLAMVALPCQIHALRTLEQRGHPALKSVSLIIGLYCGNQLHFGATRSFLRRHGVRDLSDIAEIRYRDGQWPGNVRCILKNGDSFAVPKFHFNHLISFYAVPRCLLCTDLAAEGADISVADAWGAKDSEQGGSSLVITRTQRGETIVSKLAEKKIIESEEIDLNRALAMHAHGLDLKKTGAMLRIKNLENHNRPCPQYDLPIPNPPLSRQISEVLVTANFNLLRTRAARWMVDRIPFRLIGSAYNVARIIWKKSAAKKYSDFRRDCPNFRVSENGTVPLAHPKSKRSCSQWWQLVGPILLIIMLWRIGPEKCWSVISDADFSWFFAACLVSIPSIVAKGLRWQWMLRAIGVQASLSESTGVYAAGMLAGAVTPGKVGDLAKAPMLLSRGVPLKAGVAVSLLDRVFDGVVLLALGLIGLLAMPTIPGRGIIAVATVIAFAITLAAAYIFRKSFTLFLHITSLRWWLVIATTTLAASAMYFGSAFFCAKATGLSLSILDVIAGSSVAAVLALLPISISGIGTRDAAFVAIFARSGTDAEHAIAFSSMILAWMLVNCVLFFIVSRLCYRDMPQSHVHTQSNGEFLNDSAN